MTDVDVLTAHKGWVWDERSLARLLTTGHFRVGTLPSCAPGSVSSLTERADWVRVGLGGDPASWG